MRKIRLTVKGEVVCEVPYSQVAAHLESKLANAIHKDDKALYGRLVMLQPIDAWKFHAVMELQGLKGYLETVLSQMPEPDQSVARARLEYSLTYDRFDPMVEQLAVALGLSEHDLDMMWRVAVLL